MILIGSFLSLYLISLSSVYNNLIIDILVSSAKTPLFGSGGFVNTFNLSASDHGPNQGFLGIWDYPIIFCDFWNKYYNDTNMLIFAEFNLPGLNGVDVFFDIESSHIYKYQSFEWFAITIGFCEIFLAIFLEWCIHKNKYYLIEYKFFDVKMYCILFVLTSLLSTGFIITNSANILWYVKYDESWGHAHMPFDTDIIDQYKYLFCIIAIFNIITLPIYKIYDLNKKYKCANDEHNGLLQE